MQTKIGASKLNSSFYQGALEADVFEIEVFSFRTDHLEIIVSSVVKQAEARKREKKGERESRGFLDLTESPSSGAVNQLPMRLHLYFSLKILLGLLFGREEAGNFV